VGFSGERAGEIPRKIVHVGCGLLAFALRWMSWPAALGLALAALAFNAFVLPRIGGRKLHRPHERDRTHSAGILLYPFSIVLLVLLFRERLFLVGAGWALMAFGDGFASLVGTAWGRHRLPWNDKKSWEGTAAFFLAGSVATWLMLAWLAPPPGGRDLAGWLVVALLATLVAAILESLPTGVDDNLVVPLGGAGATLLFAHAGAFVPALLREDVALRAGLALLACAVLAGAALWRRSLDVPGAIAAVVVGALLAAFGGWTALLVLCAFYALGTGATRLGRRIKEQRGIAQERGGRRSLAHVLANAGFALACAPLLLVVDASVQAAARIGLVAALATAAFDTVSSEIGKAWGRRTFLATSLRPVPPGTEGAVSLEGTLAGAGAALAVALVALIPRPLLFGPLEIVLVVVGALAGTSFESVAGAWLSSKGRDVNNHALNFANTAVGALVAIELAALLR
jgi:uncharacterized protein (TIGR00297 family)